MAEKKVDASAAGCLARLFTLMGIFLFGSALFNQIRNFSGDGVGFDITGALIPGLVLLAIGGSLRRRANASKPDQGRVQIPLKPPPKSPPSQLTPPPKTKAPPTTKPPVLDIPELPKVEEIHQPGELPALEDLSLDDFEADKPMSSEERIRLAKERYRKKP